MLEILLSLILCGVLMLSIISWRLVSTIGCKLASSTVTNSFDEIKDDTGVVLSVAEGFVGVSSVPFERTSNWVSGPI
jgi:hypothetical protein